MHTSHYAPTKGQLSEAKPWEGPSVKKPWEYRVTACIPVLDTPDEVALVVQLLELQKERPFIQIVDTGSTPENWAKIEKLRSDSVEVHQFRFAGVQHPSDFPAVACDFAFSSCRTEFCFMTHADCFLMNRDVVGELVGLCSEAVPVVGYEISPRSHKDWVGMVSHTCSICHMKTMDRIGAGWNLRRLCHMFGLDDPSPNPLRPNWPDTELLLNYVCRSAGVETMTIGKEENFCRTLDHRIDHCRTLTAGKLYSPEYYAKASEWALDAMKQAKARIASWKADDWSKRAVAHLQAQRVK